MINIYDYETLSTDNRNAPLLSVATLQVDEKYFVSDTPYTYEDLLDRTKFMKLDVAEQVREYDAKIDPNTVKWWSEQNAEAKKQLKPSPDDKSLFELVPFLKDNIGSGRVYTRGCSLDHPVTINVCKRTGQDMPYKYWDERDTRSYLEGLSNDEVPNGFIPDEVKDKFVAHDPRHDIALDIYRIQTLKRAILGLKTVDDIYSN